MIHTLIHEIRAHGLDYKDGKEDVSGEKAHEDYHADPDFYKKHPKSQSPEYDSLKPNSPSGKDKAKIETYFKKLLSVKKV